MTGKRSLRGMVAAHLALLALMLQLGLAAFHHHAVLTAGAPATAAHGGVVLEESSTAPVDHDRDDGADCATCLSLATHAGAPAADYSFAAPAAPVAAKPFVLSRRSSAAQRQHLPRGPPSNSILI